MTDCSQIIERLRGDDPEALREAAQDAGDYDCHESVAALVALLRNKNLGVQEAAEISLLQLGGAETVQRLTPLLRESDAQVRNLAMDILRQLSDQDIETIFELQRDDDADIRIFAADILGSTGNILAVPHLCQALLQDPEVNVRYQAAVSLGNLAFVEAAKCLDQAIHDEEWVQFSVIEALLKIRSESSIDALIKAMPQSSDLVSSMIVDALAEMGNIKAVPLLLKKLDSSPAALRNKIVKAIVQIMGGRTLTLLPALEQSDFKEYLLAALQDEDEDIQDQAITGLVNMKVLEAAEPIIDLGGALDPERDDHQDRLDRIAKALAEIGSMPALRVALHSGEPNKTALAVRALRLLPNSQTSALLMNFFSNKDRNLQRTLIDALVQVACKDDAHFFLDLLDSHNDGHILKQSLNFIASLGKLPQATEKVFALLEHPYPDVREIALGTCIAIGDQTMLEKFQQMFTSPDPAKRTMAVLGLGNLGCSDHMSMIKNALEDESTSVRKAALEAGIKLCGLTEELFTLVSQRLQDEDREVRLVLISLLGECDGHNVNIVPLLRMALTDGYDWVRVRAVEALGNLRAAEAIPDLVNLLHNGNRLVSIKAVWALGRIGGQTAFQILMDVLNSDDPELISAAEEAILHLQEREEEPM
ncbi:MAG TPA: HEAT repeat domain-containing protein [Desulfonatronum sp.]|nr:HEAT repeat domain-containing protein [Desulfonatronum sp.]